jgi:hypothetical protein
MRSSSDAPQCALRRYRDVRLRRHNRLNRTEWSTVIRPASERPMMTHYLISFPSEAMVLSEEDFAIVVDTSHDVAREMRDAGVLVFAGGIDEGTPPVRVGADNAVSTGTYPQTVGLTGGFTVIDVATREEAVQWAARVAAGCRCTQELRAFHPDDLSRP